MPMTNDTMTINGTVNSINQVSTPFDGVKLVYTTVNGKETSALFGTKFTDSKAGESVKEALSNIEEGSLVQVVLKKNTAGFFNPASIKLLDKLPESKTQTNSFNKSGQTRTFDVTGQIKGNAVTNAVQLAIARKGPKTTLTELKEALNDVLDLHAHAETLNITEHLKGNSSKKSTRQDVNKSVI